MNTKTEPLSLRDIREAFDKLSGVFYSANINWADRLLAMCKEEEKGHRGCMPDFRRYHPSSAGISDMGKLFAVKRVAEYLNGEEFPRGQEYLHTQTSCFIAAGIVDEFGGAIRQAWSDYDMAQLIALDYTDFVKTANPLKP